jgi:hypothetical protein
LRLHTGDEGDDDGGQIEEDDGGLDHGRSYDDSDSEIEGESGDDDSSPPPKEDQESVSAVLVKIIRRLEYCETEIVTIDWSKDSPASVRSAIDEMIGVLQRMQERIPTHV